MKLITNAFVATAGIATVASAIGHNHHQHAHLHHHEERAVDTVVVNDVAIKYIFDGQEVPLAQVCQGLANGTFAWDADASEKPNCSPEAAPHDVSTAVAPVSSSSSAAAKPSAPAAANFLQQSSSSTKASSAVATPSAVSNVQVNTNANYMSLLTSHSGVDTPFPSDGEGPCTFSTLQKYGAVPLPYLGLSGFTAITNAPITNGIVGMIQDLATGGNGDYYSYSCPQGYMKTQWPSQKSSSTIGGVQCVDGKFMLTNPDFSTLCTPGAGSVTATNNVGKVISVCRTDYPSTESETIPAQVNPGGTAPLVIADTPNYFKASGAMGTSNQYYLNPAGYGIADACDWFTNETPQGIARGNWAPANLGLGTDDTGSTVYVGLFSAEQVLHDPASPGTPVPLNYNVKVSSPAAPGMTCEYRNENGQGNFYLSGSLQGYLGQTFEGKSVPGATCAYPVGSEINVSFD